MRVWKNVDKIRWKGEVHEKLTGGVNISPLPMMEDLSFYHIKEFDRQKKQNDFYDTIG